MEKVYIIGTVDNIGKCTIHEQLEDKFIVEEIPDETDYGKLADANYVVLRGFKMRREAIEQAPGLKLIQRWGVGYDSVDIKVAGENGIQVAVTAGLNSVPVSEYAVMLMLAVYRNLIPIHKNVAAGGWRDDGLIQRSYTIHGKRVGLVGIGSIGRQVAAKVKAFGAEVCYYDLSRLDTETEQSIGITYLGFDEMLSSCDIISLHLPLTETTKNLINAEKLALMKKTAIIVNTARGAIIEEDALYNALKNGQILGAGLDVFSREPPSGSPLLGLSNIVLSSHSAGNTIDNSVLMARRCAENIRKVSQGFRLEPPDLVNKQELLMKSEVTSK